MLCQPFLTKPLDAISFQIAPHIIRSLGISIISLVSRHLNLSGLTSQISTFDLSQHSIIHIPGLSFKLRKVFNSKSHPLVSFFSGIKPDNEKLLVRRWKKRAAAAGREVKIPNLLLKGIVALRVMHG